MRSEERINSHMETEFLRGRLNLEIRGVASTGSGQASTPTELAFESAS